MKFLYGLICIKGESLEIGQAANQNKGELP